MRLSLLSVGLLALLTPLTSAWSKEDREIFRLRDEIATHEGADVTFYDFLGVSTSANQDDINKAYKKRAKALHPDKVKAQIVKEKKKGQDGKSTDKKPSKAELDRAVKTAGERQARLGVVTNILRGEGRDRYDHFLSNGFPVWKGTEYYYNRYRPGLGTVLFGCLLAFGGGFHYLALYMSWKRQQEFVHRYIKFARHAAWGDNNSFGGVPGLDEEPAPAVEEEQQQAPAVPVNRKMRRMQERESRKESGGGGISKAKARTRRAQQQQKREAGSGTATPNDGPGPQGAKKRVVAENGKVLVVDSLGDVYLEQQDEDGHMGEYLLDPSEFPKPTIRDTALVKLPGWIFRTTVGRVLGGGNNNSNTGDDVTASGDVAAAEEDNDSSSSDAAVRTPSSTGSSPGEDFEFLDKSTESLKQQAKTSGSSGNNKGNAKKRGNKKR